MRVSVILPVYNAQSTLQEAIDSILSQSFRDFELIIINDGSTDNSEKIIKNYSDSRIVYINNITNKGLIFSLNEGLRISSGDYIARMDADDISVKERFQKQVDYLDKNPECIVCGSQIEFFGNISQLQIKRKYFENSKSCKDFLLMYPCFAHPAVMMRGSIIRNKNIKYNADYKNVEDYKLWIDLSNLGDFHNLSDILLFYRISNTQITSKGNVLQTENAIRCRREYAKKYCSIDLPLKIDLKFLKESHSELLKNQYLLQCVYMSQDRYAIGLLNYYIFSGDIFRFNMFTNMRILKRFLRKSTSLL